MITMSVTYRLCCLLLLVLYSVCHWSVQCQTSAVAADKIAHIIQQAQINDDTMSADDISAGTSIQTHTNDDRVLLSSDRLQADASTDAWTDTGRALLQRYVQRNNLLYEQLLNVPDTSARYLIYRDVGCEDIVGMGNRINGFISALILAYVTGRLFLLDQRLTDGTYECTVPCTRCHTITSMINMDKLDIRWQYPTSSSIGVSDELRALTLIEPWIDWPAHGVFYQSHTSVLSKHKRFRTTVINLRYEHFENAATQFLACNNFNSEYMQSINAIVMYSSQSYAHLLLSNPHHRNSMLSQFGVRAYRQFAQYFMAEPAARLQPTIQSTVRRMASAGCTRPVGIHIRRHDGREFLNNVGESTILNCAQWTVMEYARNTAQTDGTTTNQLATDSCIFISSDSVQTRDAAKSDLSQFHVGVYWLEDSDVEIDASSRETQDAAVIDWFILRQCADRVITAGSSFGLSAAYGSLAGTAEPLTTITAQQDKWYTGTVCVRYPAVGPISNPLLGDVRGTKPLTTTSDTRSSSQLAPLHCAPFTDLGYDDIDDNQLYVKHYHHQPQYAISVHSLYLPPQWWYTDIFTQYMWPIIVCSLCTTVLLLRCARNHYRLTWPARLTRAYHARGSKVSPSPTPSMLDNHTRNTRNTRSSSFQLGAKADTVDSLYADHSIAFGRRRSGRLSNASEQPVYQHQQREINGGVWPTSPSRWPTVVTYRNATSPRTHSHDAHQYSNGGHGQGQVHVLHTLHSRNQSYQ